MQIFACLPLCLPRFNCYNNKCQPGRCTNFVHRPNVFYFVVDLELACGKVLSVLYIDYSKFTEWKDTLPFYKNIQKDGVVLWQAA